MSETRASRKSENADNTSNLACPYCLKPATSENMVECVMCKCWIHYHCALVGDEVADVSVWLCKFCDPDDKPPQRKSEQNIATTSKPKSNASSKSSSSRKKELEKRLRDTQREMRLVQAEKELLTKERQIQEEIESLSDASSVRSHKSAVNAQPIPRIQRHEPSQLNFRPRYEPPQTSSHAFPNFPRHEPQQTSSHPFPNFPQIPRAQSTLYPSTTGPTPAQLTARHTMGHSLCKFSGNPRDWPVFHTSFRETTIACGFSHNENLVRLQRSLEGNALTMVQGLLTKAENVPVIMEMLKNIFGRPDLIVGELLDKIKAHQPIKSEKFDELVAFAVEVRNLSVTLEDDDLEDYRRDPSMMKEIIARLPQNIKLRWAEYSVNKPDERHDIIKFSSWLFEIAMALCQTLPQIMATKEPEKERHFKKKTTIGFHNEHEKKCVCCKNAFHPIDECRSFLNANYSQKWNVIRNNRLCGRCLEPHNYKDKCPHPGPKCTKNKCERNHHPLLHKEMSEKPNEEVVRNFTHNMNDGNTRYRYMLVTLHYKGQKIDAYAFLDEGSSTTLMTQELADKLNAKGINKPLSLEWTDESVKRNEPQSEIITLRINIKGKGPKTVPFEARTVSSLRLPTQSLNYEEIAPKYEHLAHLPINSYRDVIPEILIGLDNWTLALPTTVREGKIGEPIAAKCKLGWTIFAMNNNESKSRTFFHICEETKSDDDLHQLVTNYFKIDHLGIEAKQSSLNTSEENKALKIMESTAKRRPDGRFEIGLLWRNQPHDLPDSELMSLRRLEGLKRSLKHKPEILEAMEKQIADYLEKGYIREVTQQEINENRARVWYLPIFVALNPNKPGKIRMVWDAAAKVKEISLNSMLLSGPDLTAPLLQVVFQSREGPYAIAGDIREMFHRVYVIPQDQYSQLFHWLDGRTMAMQVLTFGSTCSPASAQYVKNLNATEYKSQYPDAYKAIVENTYVDDWLQSFETEEKAIETTKNVITVHAKAGFEIRNWISNSKKVLRALQGDDKSESSLNLNLDEPLSVDKVLGMWWNTERDSLTFSLKFNKGNKEVLNGERTPTKRELLRILMSIFDPLGLLGHYLITLKILLQHVWKSKIDWDEPINKTQDEKFQKWREILPQIQDLHIPRCYLHSPMNEETEIELHAFVDASEEAEAAVVYIRIKNNDSVRCVLVASKTKVAPLRILSIPRLELESAVIGARLVTNVKAYHQIPMGKLFMWTDSTTVLSWINNNNTPKKERFIAFRVAEILEKTSARQWNHVPSELNVADKATKMKLRELDVNDEWFNGPKFLYEDVNKWPAAFQPSQMCSESEIIATHVQQNVIIDVNRFSSWLKLRKTVAFLYYFRDRIQSKHTPNQIPPEIFARADDFLYKYAQNECFGKELSILQSKTYQNKRKIVKSGPLKHLSPYVDNKGVLRVKGRVNELQWLPDDTKNPIILPSNHKITFLIVNYYHEKWNHENHSVVLNDLRAKFQISRVRALLNKVRASCQKCKILFPKPIEPLMGDLPKARISPYTAPFTYTGIDYCGPFPVTVKRSTEKRWVALFTCLTTRAIHTEIAHGLDADNCVMCIRNFMLIRGQPNTFYSDCGTNFVAADKILREEIKSIKNKDVMKHFEHEPIKWKFNPPGAAHMGGAWERLVRALKKSLYAAVPSRNFTDPLLKACLTEATYVVNSRPLTYLSIANEEHEVLTPNHFLIGSHNGVKPTGVLDDSQTMLKHNYLTAQQFRERMWKRWVAEYLPDLVRRTKNFEPSTPLKIGDVVIVCDNNLPANTWPKGIVSQVMTGRDGQTRSAIVKTNKGEYHRPTSKLAKIDVEGDQ